MNAARRPTFCVISRGEHALAILLRDVLAELGVHAVPPSMSAAADLVLVHVDLAEGAGRSERQLRAFATGGPTIAILPFMDEGLIAAADRAGASSWYALGTPLDLLANAVRQVLADRRSIGATQ